MDLLSRAFDDITVGFIFGVIVGTILAWAIMAFVR